MGGAGDAARRRIAPHDFFVAESFYERSRTLATELGMRPVVAHCHLGLGKLYRRTGKSKRAQEYLTTAMTMYGEMGMTYWLERPQKFKVVGLSEAERGID